MHTKLSCCLLMTLILGQLAYGGLFDKDDGRLTPQQIEDLQTAFQANVKAGAIVNAVTNNDVKELVLNRTITQRHDDIFNFKIKTQGITDQHSTGRCWMFAGLNLMRPVVMQKYNLSSFEFSENYLFFWDKLEKANTFLEAIIATRDRPIEDRELQALLKNPVPDGGWWSDVVSLIEKHGVVPLSIMPETANSKASRRLNYLLNNLMRRTAADIRAAARQGDKEKTLRDLKNERLQDVYKLLVYHLGEPPRQEFVWRTQTQKDSLLELTFTPQSFYTAAVGLDLQEYVSLLDHPLHGYHHRYRINFCRNMPEVPNMDFININVNEFKDFALQAVLDSTPVWFAADVGHDMDRDQGIMAVGLYDYQALFEVNTDYDRKVGVAYGGRIPNHAMVLIGVDTLANGRPRKWLVENSWGTDTGNQGYWTMYDNWFDKYVFNVIIPAKYLPEKVRQLRTAEPQVLPAWDPMRAAFQR